MSDTWFCTHCKRAVWITLAGKPVCSCGAPTDAIVPNNKGEFNEFLKPSNTPAGVPAIPSAAHAAPAGKVHAGAAKDCPVCSTAAQRASARIAGTLGTSPPAAGDVMNLGVGRTIQLSPGVYHFFPTSTPQPITDRQVCSTCNHSHPDEPCPLDGEPEVVEDYLIGFRSWFVQGERLLPIFYQDNEWLPGENTARCGDGLAGGPKEPHPVPAPRCACGFYMRWSLSAAPSNEILGAVKASGRIIEHGEDGFRAEKAEIVALLDSGPRVAAIAKAYGVPALGYSQLMQHVREFGELRYLA